MPDSEKTNHVTQGHLFFILSNTYLLISFAFLLMAEGGWAAKMLFWAVSFGVSIVYLVASYRAGYCRLFRRNNNPG